MWTVVYMSKNADESVRLRKAFKEKAIISMLRERDGFFEILVPSMEVSLAHRTIIEMEI